jgi:hypothetical protein
MFNPTKATPRYTAQAKLTTLHNPTPTHKYKFTPRTTGVYCWVRLRCMGVTFAQQPPTPMYTATPLHKLAQYL